MTLKISETARQIVAMVDREKELDEQLARMAQDMLIVQAQKEGIIAARKRLAQEIGK